ncbi:hypothetical protein Tco_0844718, partial [Tanacetum coccineum]
PLTHHVPEELELGKMELGMDKSKITRKPSKTGKHGHGKWKSTREAKDSKPKPEKVKLHKEKLVKSKALISSLSSNAPLDLVKAQGCVGFTLLALTQVTQGVTITDCHAGNPYVHICDPTAKANDLMIEGMDGDD